jgi:membrane-bound metal-dependent hydrolase YbcI (DUF457 family)
VGFHLATKKEHAQTGAIFSAIALALLELHNQSKMQKINIDWWQVLKYAGVGAGIGAFAGILPDIFEPADYPQHRKTMHSKSIFILCIYLTTKIQVSQLNCDLKKFYTCLLVGYISHLLEDLQTPKGLPII